LPLTDRFFPLHDILQSGIQEEVCTAAVGLVGLKGEPLWQGVAGRLSRTPHSPPVTLGTLFDLASLTKPLGTSLALMLLIDQGLLRLESTLGEILPRAWLPEDKWALTIKSLLAHRAGLAGWRPYYRDILRAPAPARATLLERLAATEPFAYPPEEETLYSDLGFMLLKAVVETIVGMNLDEFCRREIYQPLGLTTLGFNPLSRPGGDKFDFAATETSLISERNIAGEVHDENAWAAGGIAGHSGLFGTGPEVFALAAALYRTFQGERVGPFQPDSVRLFFTPVMEGGRALGFDVPSADLLQSSAGRFFSPRSVGHLGFTGVSFWLDLEQGQMAVLLTNRVHLGRDNDKIRGFRPQFHEAASRALGCAG
jgi:CubicO group peptidase (beta-lactamase class C family)